jgi:hypothetical protein
MSNSLAAQPDKATIEPSTDGLPPVRLDHDALECLKVSLFAEHMHPAARSVKDVVKKPPGCDSRCSWHNTYRYHDRGTLSVLIAYRCPSPEVKPRTTWGDELGI